MLDLRLFHNGRFSAGIVSGLVLYLVMFGVLLLIPFYLERGLGFGTARVGLELMALPVCFGLVALFRRQAGRSRRAPAPHGERHDAGCRGVWPPSACSGRPRSGTLLLLATVGVGLGLFTPPNNAAIMEQPRPNRRAWRRGS